MSSDIDNSVSDLSSDRVEDLIAHKVYTDKTKKTPIIDAMASKLNVSTTTVFRWLREDSIPHKYYEGIASFFSITVDELLIPKSPTGEPPHEEGRGYPEKHVGKEHASTVSESLDIPDHFIEHDPNDPQQEMEVPKELAHQIIRIPEWVDIVIFGQVAIRLRFSTPIPGKRQTIDITDKLIQVKPEGK